MALSPLHMVRAYCALLLLLVAGCTPLLAQDGLTVSPVNHLFGAVGGTLDISVSAPADLAWTASSNAAWLTVTAGAAGTGPGTVRLNAALNESSLSRDAQVTIGSRTVFIAQEPLTATLQFRPNAVTVGAAGAVRSILTVVEPANLPWQAVSDSNWITVLTARDVGTGVVDFVVATNTTQSTRVGTISALGSTLTVTQTAGAPVSFSLSSTSLNVPYTGASSQVAVTSSSPDAAWVAHALVPWAATDTTQYVGDGTVSFSVLPNPLGEARQGYISIAGINFLLNQEANPDPEEPGEGPEPGSSFTVTSGQISYSVPVGSTSETSRSLGIGSTGEELSFDIEVTNAPWLRARRTTGTTPDNIIFTANPTDLPVGVHFGTIRIVSRSNSAVTQLSARLEVTPPPGTPEVPALSQGSLFFSRIVGEAVPALRRVRVGRPGQVLSANVSTPSAPIWLQASSQTDLEGTTLTIAIRNVNMQPGLYEANVFVTSPSGQFADFSIPVAYRVELAPMGRPYIGSAGIVSAASFGEGISPNTWISIFGSNLAKTTREWTNSDIIGGVLPTKLDGVQVKIGGANAAIAYVSPGQLNVLAPAATAYGRAEIVVSVDGEESASAVGYLSETLPAFFTFGPQSGKYAAAVHLNSTTPVGPADLFSTGTPARPAKPGEIIQIFGTGFGATTPPVDPGRLFTGAATLVDFSALEILVGGLRAQVGFAGLSATGLNQFNVTIPSALAAGDHELTARIGNTYTKSGVFVRVEP